MKSFVREPYEIARFDQQNKANFYANMKSAKLMGTLSPVIEFIAALGVTAIIWFLAAVPSSAVTLRLGPLWLSSSMPSIFPIRSSGLPAYWEASKRRLPRLNVSFYIMDLTDTIPQKPDAITLPSVEGNVEFRHVSFAYNKGRPFFTM